MRQELCQAITKSVIQMKLSGKLAGTEQIAVALSGSSELTSGMQAAGNIANTLVIIEHSTRYMLIATEVDSPSRL